MIAVVDSSGSQLARHHVGNAVAWLMDQHTKSLTAHQRSGNHGGYLFVELPDGGRQAQAELDEFLELGTGQGYPPIGSRWFESRKRSRHSVYPNPPT